MPTLLDTLQKGTAYLEKNGVDEARLNMQLLIAHVLKCQRMQLYVDFDRPMEERNLEQLREMIKRRGQGEPLQHLLGTVEFGNHEFKTDDRALIPRPETEELVSRLLAVQTWPVPLHVLDVGCGSGVIGLSLASEVAKAKVTLADVSSDALELARENAEQLGVEVDFIESDLFSGVPTDSPPFDLIVANLPYIPNREITLLSREVQRDPVLALAGGEEGTELMLMLIADAPAFLAENGKLALEYGIGQAESLKNAAEEAGFQKVKIGKDLGGIERFLFAVKKR